MNALFMFSNVGVNGSQRIVQSLKSPKVRRTVGGIVVAQIMLDILNRAMAGDDDDGRNAYDAIERHYRERNLIIMKPGTDDYWTIPLPYGFNLFAVMGQSIGAVAEGARGPAEVFVDLLSAAQGSFNPAGSDPTTSLGQFVAPTVFDPAVQILENKTWFGTPIVPDGGSWDKRPDHQKHYRSVSGIAKAVTCLLYTSDAADE